jgi:hypothetical protein
VHCEAAGSTRKTYNFSDTYLIFSYATHSAPTADFCRRR